jgi:hypothetical protein
VLFLFTLVFSYARLLGRGQVQRDFEELPAEAADSLRGSLISLLLRFSRGAPPVRTQLCLALAAMPPHMAAGSWGEGGVINWLAQHLGQVTPATVHITKQRQLQKLSLKQLIKTICFTGGGI